MCLWYYKKFKLDVIICNNKQRWNKNKCRGECKELIDEGICDNRFIWNPSNCEYECDKTCDIGEYLDYENCKCRKKLVDKLIDECTETIEEVKLANITIFEMKIIINMVLVNAVPAECILYWW